MINEYRLLWFITTIIWLNSRLRPRLPNFRRFQRPILLLRLSQSITLQPSSWWLLLLLILSILLLLLLYYNAWTNILLQMLLILFILINTWSHILHLFICRWNNLLSLDFDAWASFASWLDCTSWFFGFVNSSFVVDVCF